MNDLAALLLPAIVTASALAIVADSPVPVGERALPATSSRRVLIIGSGMVAEDLAASLKADCSVEVVGYVDEGEGEGSLSSLPRLGHRTETTELVRQLGIDEVIIASGPSWKQDLSSELGRSVTLKVVPTYYEALLPVSRVEAVGDLAVITLGGQGKGRYAGWKRVFDLMAAWLVLIFLGPMMALVALAVRLTSPGPIIFSQERVGLNGQPFTLFKFRTMVEDAEAATGPTLSQGERDSRLTPIGIWLRKCRLDELPQFWNVLKGEMSLIGPRPERPIFVERFLEQLPDYAHRHDVLPGLTGLAQVCGNYHTRAADKLRFDLIYVSHQSLWLDLIILLRTVGVVLGSKGS